MMLGFDADRLRISQVRLVAHALRGRVRVRNDGKESVPMCGAHHWLHPGESALVDKSLVWFVH